MSPEELDQLILARAQLQWRKVAYIVASIGHDINDSKDDKDNKYDAIAARIAALVESGKLEAQGNPAEWRASEVRLPQN